MQVTDKKCFQVTDKNVLPITQLHFGRTQPPSYSVHTLGRLVCAGSVALNGFPTSCVDLWLIGHTLKGFYSSIQGVKMMEAVYCDFTQLPDDPSKSIKITISHSLI